MGTKMIPLSRLEADPQGTLTECCESGEALVVELPDHRLVAIQSLEAGDDDSLVSDLLESDPAFRTMVARSKAGPRKALGSTGGTDSADRP